MSRSSTESRSKFSIWRCVASGSARTIPGNAPAIPSFAPVPSSTPYTSMPPDALANAVTSCRNSAWASRPVRLRSRMKSRVRRHRRESVESKTVICAGTVPAVTSLNCGSQRLTVIDKVLEFARLPERGKDTPAGIEHHEIALAGFLGKQALQLSSPRAR